MNPETQVERDTHLNHEQTPPDKITKPIQYSLNLVLVFNHGDKRTSSNDFSEKEYFFLLSNRNQIIIYFE